MVGVGPGVPVEGVAAPLKFRRTHSAVRAFVSR